MAKGKGKAGGRRNAEVVGDGASAEAHVAQAASHSHRVIRQSCSSKTLKKRGRETNQFEVLPASDQLSNTLVKSKRCSSHVKEEQLAENLCPEFHSPVENRRIIMQNQNQSGDGNQFVKDDSSESHSHSINVTHIAQRCNDTPHDEEVESSHSLVSVEGYRLQPEYAQVSRLIVGK